MNHPIDVLCFSHLRWGFVYQRPNHLMERWARRTRTFFLEEPVVEDTTAPTMRQLQILPNLTVVVPVLRDGQSPAERVCTLRELLDDFVRKHQLQRALHWYYTPLALDFARHLDAAATVYDCMDELTGFHGAPPELRERESELFERADVVFTGGHSLYEAKSSQHPNVHAFPSSVDREHFARARAKSPDRPDPEDQRNIHGPRLGFFGVIDERMDLGLVEALADARPHAQIILVGPVVKIDPGRLPRRKNIHYLGMKSYAQLPEYIAGWDVAIMPFALNDATRFISPTKTLEYFAAGKSVVSTPIRDVVRPYGDMGIVRIAETPAEFAAAVDAALADGHTERARVETVLDATSWDETWARMKQLVDLAVTHRVRRASSGREGISTCSTT